MDTPATQQGLYLASTLSSSGAGSTSGTSALKRSSAAPAACSSSDISMILSARDPPVVRGGDRAADRGCDDSELRGSAQPARAFARGWGQPVHHVRQTLLLL